MLDREHLLRFIRTEPTIQPFCAKCLNRTGDAVPSHLQCQLPAVAARTVTLPRARVHCKPWNSLCVAKPSSPFYLHRGRTIKPTHRHRPVPSLSRRRHATARFPHSQASTLGRAAARACLPDSLSTPSVSFCPLAHLLPRREHLNPSSSSAIAKLRLPAEFTQPTAPLSN